MKTKKKEKYIPALSFDFLTPFYDTAVKWATRETVFKEKLVGQIEIIPNGRLEQIENSIVDLNLGG